MTIVKFYKLTLYNKNVVVFYLQLFGMHVLALIIEYIIYCIIINCISERKTFWTVHFISFSCMT